MQHPDHGYHIPPRAYSIHQYHDLQERLQGERHWYKMAEC
jgi:hypothetical protein